MQKYVLGPNAARELKRILRGTGEVSRRKSLGDALAFSPEYVHPFEVKWAQSVADGDGAWIIWIPGDGCLVVDGESVDLTADLEAAGGDYPSGWYILDCLAASGSHTLYLQVTLGDSPSAEFADDPADDDDVLDITICAVTTNGTTGERKVSQFVTSAIAIGGAAEDKSAFRVETTTGSNGSKTHVLKDCNFYWDGDLQELEDFNVDSVVGGGSVYLIGTQEAPSEATPDPEWEWKLGTTPQQDSQTGKVLNFKLYDFSGDKVSVDYRTTFLALTDHTQKAKMTVAKKGSDSSILLDAVAESPKLVLSDGTNTVTIDLADIDGDCGGDFRLRELKFIDKDGNEQTYHGLFCDDIDLKIGKTIKGVNISPSTSETVVTFTYTDGSTDTIHIPHGTNGSPGTPGQDGDTPKITGEKVGGTTHIFADGVLIATIFDGKDGEDGAPGKDGEDGETELPDLNVVTDVSFSIASGKLKATVAKKNLKTGTASQSNVDVCNISELDVVTSEVYSTSTYQFTNTRKRIQVIGSPVAAQGETPFTATPLSSE